MHHAFLRSCSSNDFIVICVCRCLSSPDQSSDEEEEEGEEEEDPIASDQEYEEDIPKSVDIYQDVEKNLNNEEDDDIFTVLQDEE
jgi:hypothetical protein